MCISGSCGSNLLPAQQQHQSTAGHVHTSMHTLGDREILLLLLVLSPRSSCRDSGASGSVVTCAASPAAPHAQEAQSVDASHGSDSADSPQSDQDGASDNGDSSKHDSDSETDGSLESEAADGLSGSEAEQQPVARYRACLNLSCRCARCSHCISALMYFHSLPAGAQVLSMWLTCMSTTGAGMLPYFCDEFVTQRTCITAAQASPALQDCSQAAY